MMSFINLPLSPPQEASNQPFGYLSHFPHSSLKMASLLSSFPGDATSNFGQG